MYDFASIGDKVYIGGLYGDEFKIINNKFGTLKKIYSLIADNSLKYLGTIEMNNMQFAIDMKYVYKLSNLQVSLLSLTNNVLDEIYQLHCIKECEIPLEDTINNNISLCKTDTGINVILTISTLN